MTDKQYSIYQWSAVLLGSLWPFFFGVTFGVVAFCMMIACHVGLFFWDARHARTLTDSQMDIWMALPAKSRPRWKWALDFLERVAWPIWMVKSFLNPMSSESIQKDIERGWR